MQAVVQSASPLFSVKRLLLISGLVIFLFAGITKSTIAQTAEAISIEVEANAVPILSPGQNIFPVMIHVTGALCPGLQRSQPVDLVILTDTSTSMEIPFPSGETRINAAQRGVQGLLGGLNLNNLGSQFDHVAVITMGDAATIVTERQPTQEDLELTPSPLTPEYLAFIIDRATIANRMTANARADGATLLDGLNQSLSVLDGLGRNLVGNAAPLLLIITDGDTQPSDATAIQAQVETMRRRLPNLVVAVMAIESPELDSALLQSIADPGLFASAPTSDVLVTNLTTLADRLALRLGANNVRVSFTANTSSFLIRDRNIVPDAATVSTATITWPLVDTVNRGETLTYRFEVEAIIPPGGAVATGGTIGTAQATFLACEETVEATTSATAPVIQPLAPSPTPVPTSTALPTSTPLPTVIPTATSPAFVQGSGRDTNFTEFSGGGFGLTSTFCTPGFWDWIPWVGAFLALLLALYFIYRWFQEFRNKEERHWSDYPCLFLKSGAALWSVFLVWLFLLPVVAYICDVPESIYFWRMDGSGTGGIFLTNEYAGEDDNPAQVSVINDQGCVGCHSSNIDAGRIAAIEGGAPGRLLIADLGTGDESQIQYVGEGNAVYVDISPSGNQVVVSTVGGELLLYDLTGETPSVTLVAATDGFAATMPTWNADGNSIAFVRVNAAFIRNGLSISGTSEIWVAAVDGSSIQPLVTQDMAPGLNYYPTISPDGRWLAFTNHTGSEDSYSAAGADIWLADLATLSSGNLNVFPISGNAPNASDSWPSWNSTGSSLAFNTTRSDPNFDIVTVAIDENGATGEVVPLPAASQPGVFEHLPAWGLARDRDPLLAAWLPLWPLVLILPLLLLLAWFFCRMRPKVRVEPEIEIPEISVGSGSLGSVDLPVWTGMRVLWQPQPTLIVGLGRSGWNVLAQLKNTLIDAGLGEMPDQIRLLAIIPSKQEVMYEEDRFNGTLLSDDELIELQDPLNEIANQGKTDPSLSWLDTDFVASGRQLDPREGLRNNRMLGRLALVNNLRGNTRYTEKSIWETLIKHADTVKDDGRLNVILVTDTSDDIGSGAALDIAYIIRKIVETKLDVDTLRLTGHFITEAALSMRRDLQDVSRPLNTAAFLRELSRFQLAHGASFDMTYSTDGNSPQELESKWEQMLFDDVFVHDGRGEQGGAVYSTDPEVGIYPALADSIVLWLDSAAKSGSFGTWRNNVAQAAETAQYQRGEMVVGAMGIYQYRLPLAEILDEITTRYSRELIHRLLVGDTQEAVPQYTKASNETIRQLVQELAILPALDDYWRASFNSLLYSDDGNLQRALNRLQVDEERDDAAWISVISQQLSIILNGNNSNADIVIQRSGRLGIARDYLVYLKDTLLKNYADHIAPFDNGEVAAQQLRRFADITGKMLTQLESVARRVGIGSTNGSLYSNLVADLAEIEERENNRRDLVTRTYITHVNNDNRRNRLAKQWYAKYIEDISDIENNPIRKGLRQLNWVFNDAGEVTLNLVPPPSKDGGEVTMISFNPDDVEAFQKSLAELGRFFVRDIRDSESLSDILEMGILHEDNLQRTANDLVGLSSVMLRISTQQGLEAMRVGQILAASREIEQREKLEEALNTRTGTLQRLITTDPFTLTFAQTRDIIPLSNVSTVQDVNQTYSQQVYQASSAQPTVIFDAEAKARYYEQRLQSVVETQPHMLHPIVTTALAKDAQAVVYLLAAAIAAEATNDDDVEIQWVLQNRQGLQFENDETGTLDLVDASRIGNPRFGNLVDGLFAFINRVTPAQARNIYDEYEADPDIITVLQRFDRSQGQAWRDKHKDVRPVLLEDLISVTRIIINDIS